MKMIICIKVESAMCEDERTAAVLALAACDVWTVVVRKG
jgi:hypothetical protein